MKKHVALTLLALTTLGVLNAHVDLPVVDGRRFIKAQEKLHDPIGWVQDKWTALTASCSQVRRHEPDSMEARLSLQAIQDFSLPDSDSARLLQVQGMQGWLLAEVEFDTLSPAVVALQGNSREVKVVDAGIWSGSTLPWRAAPLIRTHIGQRAPEMPQALLDCFAPRGGLFQSH